MKPELLAPAGSPQALEAAVLNGAGAVYLGWGGFNARRGAQNFSQEEFAEALAYCHVRGVKVFLTLNILLSDRELPAALETARTASRLGVDAVLVQDWGLFRLLRRVLPDLPLHASTQMSIFTSGGACEIAGDGCRRVVLARECSRDEVAVICRDCPVEIEVFVHGALCMCYSGQCAMSAVLGGRSGNRGRCAQPCRLPYGVNGSGVAYPLSLKDSCLAPRLADLEDLGVACLKIEGRMRRPAYVATVTNIYARLLEERREPTRAEMDILKDAFSRSGFTDAYWLGRHGRDMLGTRPENAAEFTLPELSPVDIAIPVEFTCGVKAGKAAWLHVDDGLGNEVTVTGAVPEAARNRALTVEDLSARLRKTGGTPYRCVSVDVDEFDPGLSLSASAVNKLRRDALEALSKCRMAGPVRRERFPAPELPEVDCSADVPRFTVSVASAAQWSAGLLELGPARVCAPLEVLAGLDRLPEAETEWCAVLPRVWRDRDEGVLRDMLERAAVLGVTAVMAGNLGHLALVRGMGFRVYGDFGLNVFNSWSLDYLREKGLESACLSFELRFAQIRDMRKILPAEAIVYGRLPLMITENCIAQNGGACPGVCEEGCSAEGPAFLNDRMGADFPLLPVWGHRTEIQNSRVLWLADRPEYRRLGLAFARLRFTTESPEECADVFRRYLNGEGPVGEFTRGLYQRGVE